MNESKRKFLTSVLFAASALLATGGIVVGEANAEQGATVAIATCEDGAHLWGTSAAFKEATCTEDAKATVKCVTCGEESTLIEHGTARGHRFGEAEQILSATTCDGKGISHSVCLDCGYEQNVVTKDGHKYVETAREEATCLSGGSITYTCEVCENQVEESLAALGHTYVYSEVTDQTHHAVCEVCGVVVTENHGAEHKLCDCGYVRKDFIEVLLLQDSAPWFTDSNENLLDDMKQKGLIDDWVKATVEDVISDKVELGAYSLVVFANDQTAATCSAYAEIANKVNTYVARGGALVFGGAQSGWHSGAFAELSLPGGVRIEQKNDYKNTIKKEDSVIVNGTHIDNEKLTEDGLVNQQGVSVSVGYFVDFPATAITVLCNQSDDPTMIEYGYGVGCVIASTLTFEYALEYERGRYASIYEDVIVTALKNVKAYPENGCRVSYVDHEGKLFTTQYVVNGETPVAPVNGPERAGYEFLGWDVDGDGAVDQMPQVTSNQTFKAVYVGQERNVSVHVIGGGKIKFNGEDKGAGPYSLVYNHGDKVTLQATLGNSTSKFLGWYQDGKMVTNNYKYEFVVGFEDVALDAWFAVKNEGMTMGTRTVVANWDEVNKDWANAGKTEFLENNWVFVELILRDITATGGIRDLNIDTIAYNGIQLTTNDVKQWRFIKNPGGWSLRSNPIPSYGEKFLRKMEFTGTASPMTKNDQLSVGFYFTPDVSKLPKERPCKIDISFTGWATDGNGNRCEVNFKPLYVTIVSEADSVPTCTHENTETVLQSVATCTAKGYTGDKMCVACGEVVEKGREISMRAHDYEEIGNIQASCEIDGGRYQACTMCGTVEIEEKVDKFGHTKIETNTQDYCDGVKEECEVCNKVLNEGEKHVPSAWLPQYKNGVMVGKYVKCKHCGAILQEEIYVQPELPDDSSEEGDSSSSDGSETVDGSSSEQNSAPTSKKEKEGWFSGCKGSVSGVAGIGVGLAAIGVCLRKKKED